MEIKFRKPALICFLSIFIFNSLHAQGGKIDSLQRKFIYKDGKFFFYNPAYAAKGFKKLDRNLVKQKGVQCVQCNATPLRHSSITSGPIVLYITSQDATCGYGSGSIIIEAANGTAPYTYSVDGYTSLSGNFPVLGSGVHDVIVADANGVTTKTQVVLIDVAPGPVLIPYTLLSNPTSCSAGDGSLQLNPIGGTPPYTYSLDLINFQSSNVFSNLNSGIYDFYVKDAKGCIAVNELLIAYGACDGIQGTNSLYECGNNGLISFTDDGQNQNTPYLYSLDGINYQNTGDFYNLGPGVHLLYIKDKNNKVDIWAISFGENCQIKIDYIAVSAACMQNNGSLEVTAADGIAPYLYTIDGINYQSSNIFNGLAPGNYFITVKDATGVKSSLPAVVYDKCPIVRAVSSPETCLQNDAVITAAGFKGTPPYNFSIDGTNFQTNNQFTGLKTGNYTVYIKDALGFSSSIQVAVANGCLNLTTIVTPSNCGHNDGAIQLNAINGTPPYQYSFDDINFQTANLFSNLLAASYTVYVKDANGLVTSTVASVGDLQGPQINATTTAATCLNNDGGISVTTTSQDAPFLYSVDSGPAQSASIFNSLDSGQKTVSITDNRGCISQTNVIVSLTNNLNLNAGSDITICEGSSGTLTGISNGSSFVWSPAQYVESINNLQTQVSPNVSTRYYLQATLGFCKEVVSAFVTVTPAPIAIAGPDTTTCYGKEIQLQGSGGSEFVWTPGIFLDNANLSNPTVKNPTLSLVYSLTVKEGDCYSINPATIKLTVKPPAILFAGDDTSVLVNQSVQLHAVDVNGTGFSNYSWLPTEGLDNPFSEHPVANITKDILYDVKGESSTGCIAEGSIKISVYEVADIFVPNAFTPNGDGRNDILKAIPIGIKNFKYLKVFNRWGQEIFNSVTAGYGWDGSINGVPQQTGTFVWTVAGTDYKGNTIFRRGSVVLIR